jgi:hypothetical protein
VKEVIVYEHTHTHTHTHTYTHTHTHTHTHTQEGGAGDVPALGLRIKRQGSEECKVRVFFGGGEQAAR